MKKKTSKQIFADAIRELAKDKPIDKITVKEIVEKSGLSLQTFYNHFRDKADLVLWVHKSATEQMFKKMDGVDYGFRDVLRENVRFYRENRDFLLNAHTNTYGFESYEKMAVEDGYKSITAWIEKRFFPEAFPKELDFLLRMYIFALNRGHVEWQTKFPELSEETVVSYLEDACPPKLYPYLFGGPED